MEATVTAIKRTSYFGEPSLMTWDCGDFMCVAFKDLHTIRLDIYRKDNTDEVSWDDLQQIKNACGFEDKDAVEFYPAEKDVINKTNMRHLYVFDDPIPMIRRKVFLNG